MKEYSKRKKKKKAIRLRTKIKAGVYLGLTLSGGSGKVVAE